MSLFRSPRFLRHVLLADAASCAVTGGLQLLFAQPLADALRLPLPLLVGTGGFLLAYALFAGWAAGRDPVPRPLVWFFVAGNLGWAAACVALLAGPWVSPSALGRAWVLAQAACVVVLAELQWMALRRQPRAGWA